jgi:hypothetical protein
MGKVLFLMMVLVFGTDSAVADDFRASYTQLAQGRRPAIEITRGTSRLPRYSADLIQEHEKLLAAQTEDLAELEKLRRQAAARPGAVGFPDHVLKRIEAARRIDFRQNQMNVVSAELKRQGIQVRLPLAHGNEASRVSRLVGFHRKAQIEALEKVALKLQALNRGTSFKAKGGNITSLYDLLKQQTALSKTFVKLGRYLPAVGAAMVATQTYKDYQASRPAAHASGPSDSEEQVFSSAASAH